MNGNSVRTTVRTAIVVGLFLGMLLVPAASVDAGKMYCHAAWFLDDDEGDVSVVDIENPCCWVDRIGGTTVRCIDQDS